MIVKDMDRVHSWREVLEGGDNAKKGSLCGCEAEGEVGKDSFSIRIKVYF